MLHEIIKTFRFYLPVVSQQLRNVTFHQSETAEALCLKVNMMYW